MSEKTAVGAFDFVQQFYLSPASLCYSPEHIALAAIFSAQKKNENTQRRILTKMGNKLREVEELIKTKAKTKTKTKARIRSPAGTH